MRAKSQLPSRLLLGNRFSQFDSSPVRRARRQDPVRQAVRALVERMEQRVLLTHALPMFELDGDATTQNANPNTTPDDWDRLNLPAPGGSPAHSVAHTGLLVDTGSSDQIFTTGGSKDQNDLNQWQHTTGSVPDKDDITDAYAAAYVNTVNSGGNLVGDLIIYFGMDRFAQNGDSEVGFWFFQDQV